MKTIQLGIIIFSFMLIIIGLFLVGTNLSQASQTLRGCPPLENGASFAFCENWTAVQTFASGVIITIVGISLIVIASKKDSFEHNRTDYQFKNP
ncbi:MAG: hypothetical protein HY222_01690 [Thaumarchaeota archaeon]|nr:hypothetical protein [Nitrososphaerota archaeon]MBI3641087.1 hypothetical protein [Nitrososphaerota archaeon]